MMEHMVEDEYYYFHHIDENYRSLGKVVYIVCNNIGLIEGQDIPI